MPRPYASDRPQGEAFPVNGLGWPAFRTDGRVCHAIGSPSECLARPHRTGFRARARRHVGHVTHRTDAIYPLCDAKCDAHRDPNAMGVRYAGRDG